jgi:hypothetical protein
MARYKAIKRGFDGMKSREIGEIFDFAGQPGKWMELYTGPESEPVAASAKPAKKGGSAKLSVPESPGSTGDQLVI